MKSIVIIEDEAALASALAISVRRMGFLPYTAASAMRGLQVVGRERPVLVVLDIGLPDASGIEVLAEIRKRAPELPVLVITAHGNLQNAVDARQRGASGYLVKPLDVAEFETTIRSLLRTDVAITAAPTAVEDPTPLLIGSAPAMQPAFAAIAHACAADVPVLLSGPIGVGKSLAARIVHRSSARQSGPFVTMRCAGLPGDRLEAELFGSGANAGQVERAASGTLFLDEVGELPPSAQIGLLRLIEDGTFARVGDPEDRRADVRVLAASTADLLTASQEKHFREDLLYRLRVLEVQLPALAERASDVPALCAYLLARIRKGDANELALSEEALAVLQRHSWPGNVRELRSALEHAATVSNGSIILERNLPADLLAAAGDAPAATALLDRVLPEWIERRLPVAKTYDALHGELEARLLATLLPRYEGKPTLLARALSMNRATLRKRLREYGLAKAGDGDDTDA